MRRLVAAAIALAAAVPALARPAAAVTLTPSQWPTELGLGSAPNAIRFGGTDRYQTSLAIALALRGTGGFPFETPDRTSGGAGSLASAAGWWGARTCPASIIVVAGDTPADALAAASLSDPTDRSDEPRLQRVAAADPLFDPIGGFDRVDTEAAPVIVTLSGRSGAQSLSTSARAAASDLASGGCTTAREAIIVGGTAAVPAAVADELVSIGFDEVFRVAGANRFATAASIATALGTEAAPVDGGCTDPVVGDGATRMGFHGNAVVEYRPDAASCLLLGRTVVLADGSAGVDALAAGWWTSYWQVPILLVAGDGSLPPATRTALQTLDIDTIVVLGGTGRIPEPTVDEAKQLAGAVAGRFAGADRYETSVAMARVFGGWFVTGDAADFVADRVCIAASGGSSASAGWPDALAAGPWCGRLAVASGTRPSPTRAFEPVEQGVQAQPARAPAHDAAPVLLVPAGSTAPTESVAELLRSTFPSTGRWCRGGFDGTCRMPGFAIAFGGRASVSDRVLDGVSSLVAGEDSEQRGRVPDLVESFVTDLDLAPVYVVAGGDGVARACFTRSAIAGARWLALFDATMQQFVDAVDFIGRSDLSDGTSVPQCLRFGTDAASRVVALSTAGHQSTVHPIPPRTAANTVALDDDIHTEGVSTEGVAGSSAVPHGTTTWTFQSPDDTPALVSERGESWVVRGATVEITLLRDSGGEAGRFIAKLAVEGRERTLAARADGEAVLVGSQWELAGRSTTGDAVGGFRASVLTYGTESGHDDDLFWRLDGRAP